MGGDLLLLLVGFLLTSVLGGLLGYLFQGRSWAHQHEVQRRDQERQQALRTFEEVSRLLDRRLYRMRRLYWAARSRALGTGDAAGLAAAQAVYREVLFEWNDNLNRTLALVHTYFGGQVREQLEEEVYEGFATLGRGLEEIVRMVSAAGGERIEVPAFGYLVTRLSHRVYQLNVHMLGLLETDRTALWPRGALRPSPRRRPSSRPSRSATRAGPSAGSSGPSTGAASGSPSTAASATRRGRPSAPCSAPTASTSTASPARASGRPSPKAGPCPCCAAAPVATPSPPSSASSPRERPHAGRSRPRR